MSVLAYFTYCRAELLSHFKAITESFEQREWWAEAAHLGLNDDGHPEIVVNLFRAEADEADDGFMAACDARFVVTKLLKHCRETGGSWECGVEGECVGRIAGHGWDETVELWMLATAGLEVWPSDSEVEQRMGEARTRLRGG